MLVLDRSGSGRIQSWLEPWIRPFSSCGVEADGSTDWWTLESPQPAVTQRKDSDISPPSSFYLGRTDVFGERADRLRPAELSFAAPSFGLRAETPFYQQGF